jgi:hypothetical protein
MRQLHFGLEDELPGDALLQRFDENLKLCESLAAAIFNEAAQLLPDRHRHPVNPYAITLGEAEGLFDADKSVAVDPVAFGTMERIRLEAVMNRDRAYAD